MAASSAGRSSRGPAGPISSSLSLFSPGEGSVPEDPVTVPEVPAGGARLRERGMGSPPGWESGPGSCSGWGSVRRATTAATVSLPGQQGKCQVSTSECGDHMGD